MRVAAILMLWAFSILLIAISLPSLQYANYILGSIPLVLSLGFGLLTLVITIRTFRKRQGDIKH